MRDQTTKRMFFYGIFRLANDFTKRFPGSTYIGPRTIEDITIFQQFGGGIAFARPHEGGTINGDLYDVPEHFITRDIDRTEGHPNWYCRKRAVTTEGEECEIYILQDSIEDDPRYVNTGPDWTGWTHYQRRAVG